MFKKLKAWWIAERKKAKELSWQGQLDSAQEADAKEQKEICSKLDKFKYRTLSKRWGSVTLWKQDSTEIMKLSTDEAKQLSIYLQFSESEVPRYDIKASEHSKILAIRALGKKYEYKEIALQTSPPMISFEKKEIRINIYYSTMTVGTCINHPKKGKTQLFRKNIAMPALELLFKNPRQHTGKGYYTN